MKYLPLLSLIVVFTYSCGSEGYDYALEDQVLACYLEENTANGFPVERTLSELEELLIAQGFIADASGESYRAMVQGIGEDGFTILDNAEIQDAVANLSVIPTQMRCQEWNQSPMDTAQLNQSRLANLEKVFEAVAKAGDISPEVIAQSVLEQYSTQDFDHPYYRSLLLIHLYSYWKNRPSLLADQNRGLVVKEPEPGDTNTGNQILRVAVTNENTLEVDGSPIEFKELYPNVKAFLKDAATKATTEIEGHGLMPCSCRAIVSLSNDRETSFHTYLDTYKDIKRVYDDLWQERSLQLFGEEYTYLNPRNKKVIRQLIPFVVSESEPDAFAE